MIGPAKEWTSTANEGRRDEWTSTARIGTQGKASTANEGRRDEWTSTARIGTRGKGHDTDTTIIDVILLTILQYTLFY